MRKVDDGEEKKEKKIMTFIVATNVVASRLPKHHTTGTPHAHANYYIVIATTRTDGGLVFTWDTFYGIAYLARGITGLSI